MRPPDPTIMAPRSEVENVENTTDGFNHVRETAAGSGATEMGRRRGNQWRSVRQLRGFQGLSLFPRLFSVHAGLYGACICLCVSIIFQNHHTCVYDNIGFHFSNGNVCEKKHICSATDSLGDVILVYHVWDMVLEGFVL
eukprot:162258_1